MRRTVMARFLACFFRPNGHVLARLLEIIWRQFTVLCMAAIAFPTTGTALVIATNEHPPDISENPKNSFLTDVFKEVGREMGVTFEFRFMPWKRCEVSLENKEAWGTIPYVRTPERERRFYFSDTLYSTQAKFYYYSQSGHPKDISYSQLGDLKGLRIGAVSGYYYVKWFVDAGLNVEYVNTEEANLRKLKQDSVDIIPATEITAPYLIRKLYPKEVKNFFSIEKPLTEFGLHLMVSKQYPDTQNLLMRFNAALRKIKQNGIFAKMIDQHGIVLFYN